MGRTPLALFVTTKPKCKIIYKLKRNPRYCTRPGTAGRQAGRWRGNWLHLIASFPTYCSSPGQQGKEPTVTSLARKPYCACNSFPQAYGSATA